MFSTSDPLRHPSQLCSSTSDLLVQAKASPIRFFFSSPDLLFFLDLVNKGTQEVGIIVLALLHFLFSIILMLLLMK
ncbi:hypothetical protein Q3G72_021266 [Acer saccharum]|nr:hypothetical protein Q3G72_021266 [Acer saccharum]